jgi:GAF domain-containing protein
LPEANKAAIALDLAVTESAAQYLDDIAGLNTSALLSAGKTADGQLIATEAPVLLDDVTESDLILPQTQQIAAKHGFHGTAAVPPLADDQVLGGFFVLDCGVRQFADEEVSTIAGLAKQAVLALSTIA